MGGRGVTLDNRLATTMANGSVPRAPRICAIDMGKMSVTLTAHGGGDPPGELWQVLRGGGRVGDRQAGASPAHPVSVSATTR